MKLHLLAGVLFALTGAAACNSSREPIVPAPAVRQPPGDRTEEPRKPVRETTDAEKTPEKAPDRAAPARRDARKVDRDTARRVTLLWFLLRSPLGG